MQELPAGDLRPAHRRTFDPAEKALIRALAGEAVNELAPAETPLFEEDVRQFFAPARQHRKEPGEFGADEILASVTTGALAAAAALVEAALVAVTVKSWQRLRSIVRDRRGELSPGTTPDDGTDPEMAALNALYQDAYQAVRQQEGFDEQDARRIAASVLVTYVTYRAERPPADRDDDSAG